MLRSETLFGKRETTTPNQPFASNSSLAPTGASSTPKAPASSLLSGGVHHNTVESKTTTTTASTNMSSTNETGSKLIVGPNIKLKGVEITDCDTLVVEGFVEATMDSRVIQISERGAFKGSAVVDIAEIRGEFDGELTVRQMLKIYSTGRVTGKIRYVKVVIEEGGQLAGDVQVGAAATAAARGLSVAKVG